MAPTAPPILLTTAQRSIAPIIHARANAGADSRALADAFAQLPRRSLLVPLPPEPLLRVLVQRAHHRGLLVELAHLEEDAPRVHRAFPILGAVLDEALQEERVGILRSQREHAVRGDKRSMHPARCEEDG